MAEKPAASSSNSVPSTRYNSYHLDGLPKRVGNKDKGKAALEGRSIRGRSVSATALTRESRNSKEVLIAKDTLEDVRSRYYKEPNLKSSNKIKTLGDRPLEIIRKKQAADALSELYMKYVLKGGADISDIQGSKAHNCGELAMLAVYSLSSKKVKSALISIGGAAGTHAFAAILPGDYGPEIRLDSDTNEWSERIIICDPWANIACPAPEFNDLFRKKMEKWHKDGKMLASSEDGYHEYPANDKKWMNDVIMGKKEIMMTL